MVEVQNMAISSLLTTVSYPLSYIKSLTQLGHEPLTPYYKKQWFLKKYVCVYPGPQTYLSHVRSNDGFFGMFRGVKYSIMSTAIQKVTYDLAQKKLQNYTESNSLKNEDTDDYKELKSAANQTVIQIASRSSAIIVCHPFTVMSLRCMAQFVGRETVYNSIRGAIREIYNEDGLLGFFNGVVPRLIADAITVTSCHLLLYLWKKYNGDIEQNSIAIIKMFLDMTFTYITYPFSLTSNIMCVNSDRLAICHSNLNPCHKSWTACMSHLSQNNLLKRGSKLFFREAILQS